MSFSISLQTFIIMTINCTKSNVVFSILMGKRTTHFISSRFFIHFPLNHFLLQNCLIFLNEIASRSKEYNLQLNSTLEVNHCLVFKRFIKKCRQDIVRSSMRWLKDVLVQRLVSQMNRFKSSVVHLICSTKVKQISSSSLICGRCWKSLVCIRYCF